MGGGGKGATKIPVADYLMSIHFGICKGELDQMNQVYVKELPIWCGQISEYQAISVNLPELFGGDKKEGGVGGTMECYFGTADQMMTTTTATRYGKTPTTMPGYRGVGNILFRGNTNGGFKWIVNNPYLPGTWVNATRIPKGLSSEFAWIYSADPDYVQRTPFAAPEGVFTYYTIEQLGLTAEQVDQGITSIHMAASATFVGVGLGAGLLMTGFVGVEYQGYADDGFGGVGALIPGAFEDVGEWSSTNTSMGQFTEAMPPGVRHVRVKTTVTPAFPIFSIWSFNDLTGPPPENIPAFYASVLVYGPSFCTIENHLGVLPDANPAHMIYEALTDRDWGMGTPRTSIDIDSFMYAAEVFYNEKFGLSILWAEQAEIDTYVSEILDHVQAALFLDPRTGLWTLVPFRAGYDVGTLPILDPTNCKAKNRQRKALGETVNEVVVTWTNPNNEQEETVTYQDLGNIAAQGGVVSTTRNYYGIRNANLANFVGARDIRSAAYPMFGCDIIADRSMSFLRPGSVVKFNWPEDGIASMILRVSKVDYGKPGESTIKLSVTEDVFGLEQTEYTGTQVSLWESPDPAPTPMDHVEIITAPLPLLLRSGVALADLSDSDYPIAAVGVLASRNSGGVEYFDLYGPDVKPTGETFIGKLGSLIPTPSGVTTSIWTASPVTRITDAQMLAFVGFNTPDTGDFLHIEGADGDRSSEIVMLDSYAAGTWTLARGMFDTVPRRWPVGTRVWFINSELGPKDPTEQNVGVSIPYQLLPKSSGGILPLASAPVIDFTPSDRTYDPFRPANIAVASVGGVAVSYPYPITIQNAGAETSSLTGWSSIVGVTSITAVAFPGGTLNPVSGTRLFYGGAAIALSQMEQRLSLPRGVQDEADTGAMVMTIGWYQAGYDAVTDPQRVELDFYDGAGVLISSFVGPDQFGGNQTWVYRDQSAVVPALTRSVTLRFVMTRTDGTNLNCYMDAITLDWGAGTLIPLVYIGTEIPTSMSLSWATRNRLSEDTVAPRWTEGSVTPEVGQTTTIRCVETFTGEVAFEATGLTGTTYSLALASLTDYRYYDIRFLAERDGYESIQYATQQIQLVRLGYGNNYGYDYGENDGS